METFFVAVAVVLAVAGVVMLARRAYAMAVLVFVMAVVVFLLRESLTSESEEIGDGAVTVCICHSDISV